MSKAEDFLASESERIEGAFIESLKNGESMEEAEKKYVSQRKKVQKDYEKIAKKELSEKKKKKKKKKKEEKQKVFVAEGVDLRRTKKDEAIRRRRLFFFRLKRKMVNLFRKRPFDFFRYLYFRLLIRKRRFLSFSSDFRERLSEKVKVSASYIKKLLLKGKKVSVYLFKKAVNLMGYVGRFFKKLKPGKKKDDKKEESDKKKSQEEKE